MHFFSQYRGLRRENYVLFFGRIVTNMGSMVWPMLTMILNQKLGMSAGNIAILTAVFGILMMPAALFGGKLADRLNKKNIIIVGDIVSVVCYILCGCGPLGMGTIVLMFIASLFQTIEGPAYNAIIADITPLEERDKAYSLQYWGANLGLVLSPTLSGLLFKNYLWLAFIISGVAIGCSTILIWFFVRDITPVEQIGSRAEYQRARDGESIFAILRQNPTILLYLAVSALCSAAYDQYGYLMPLDLGRIHGENGAVIYGTVSSLNCIVVVLFTPFITRLFRRVIDTKKLLTGKLLFLAGYILFLTFLGTIPMYYAAMLIFTWGEIINTIADGPYLSARTPASHRGRINSVSGVAYTILRGVFNIAEGKAYDAYGSTAAWGLTIGALTISILLSVWLIFRDRARYPRLYEENAVEPAKLKYPLKSRCTALQGIRYTHHGSVFRRVPDHRDVGDIVLQKFLAVLPETVVLVELPGVGLRLDADGLRTILFPRRGDARVEDLVAVAAAALGRQHAADGHLFKRNAPVEHAEIRLDAGLVAQKHMVRLPVAPVHLLVGAFLLHDKDQHAHVQNVVQLVRRQLGIVFYDKLHGVSSEIRSIILIILPAEEKVNRDSRRRKGRYIP